MVCILGLQSTTLHSSLSTMKENGSAAVYFNETNKKYYKSRSSPVLNHHASMHSCLSDNHQTNMNGQETETARIIVPGLKEGNNMVS